MLAKIRGSSPNTQGRGEGKKASLENKNF